MQGDWIFDITLRNHITEPITVALDDFTLTDTEGNIYSLDKAFMDANFTANKFRAGNMRPGDTSGILAFKVPSGKKLESLSVKTATKQVTKKYLP